MGRLSTPYTCSFCCFHCASYFSTVGNDSRLYIVHYWEHSYVTIVDNMWQCLVCCEEVLLCGTPFTVGGRWWLQPLARTSWNPKMYTFFAIAVFMCLFLLCLALRVPRASVAHCLLEQCAGACCAAAADIVAIAGLQRPTSRELPSSPPKQTCCCVFVCRCRYGCTDALLLLRLLQCAAEFEGLAVRRHGLGCYHHPTP